MTFEVNILCKNCGVPQKSHGGWYDDCKQFEAHYPNLEGLEEELAHVNQLLKGYGIVATPHPNTFEPKLNWIFQTRQRLVPKLETSFSLGTPSPITQYLKDADGIVDTVFVDKHQINLSRSPLYTWEELIPTILAAVEMTKDR